MNSVRRLIEKVNSAISEVELLVDALLRRGMRERAAAIQKALQELLAMCEGCREEIFDVPVPSPAGVNEGDQPPEPETRIDELPGPRGGDAVLLNSALEISDPLKGREPPVVKEMKKSALLG